MATTGNKNTFNIEPLSASNYHIWKFRMKIIIEEHNVMDSIEMEYSEENYKEEKERKLAKMRDNKSYSMWKSLEERYEKKGLPGQLVLRRKFMTLKMEEDQVLDEFLINFDALVRQLKVTGTEIKDEDVQLTLSVVKSRLRADVERRKAAGIGTYQLEETKAAAFSSEGDGCYFCGEKEDSIGQVEDSIGQVEDNIRQIEDNIRQIDDALHPEVEEDMLEALVIEECTDHLVNDKRCFENLLMLDKPIKIAVAKSDNYMQALVVENVRVISKVYDNEMVCTIENVFFVPSLRRNLLSVKRLEIAGIKIIFENGKVSLCDNGREYISNEFKNYCKNNGTFIDYTTPYTPEQNGKAGRFNRSLVDKARCVLQESHMPKIFWSEAVRVAAYVLNRSPSAHLENITPAEIWNGMKPNVHNLRIIGSVAYAHVPKQFRDKFYMKSEKYRRISKLPARYNDYEMYMAYDAVSYVEKVPEKVEDLENRDDEKFWTNV
ncbi:hypothetical protein ILUMI_22209 [Ignelater luminosus]|uniref:Integrase catalytic domain-containing protein n=1 Tax=Ignelater luminosus TaxID=2038154 RepID=A0A8K0G2T7_IGNLU|nr:hypothetical protein ILUMI_22209 [Ignelater luminosus]